MSIARGLRLTWSVLSCAALLLAVALVSAWATLPAPPKSLSQQGSLAANSLFYDASGKVIGVVEGSENRYPVPLALAGAWTADATVAIEDERFWTHGGYDVRGIVRSSLNNARSAEGAKQGGSTITQQLVRTEQTQIYLMDPWQRKWYELQSSRALEQELKGQAGKRQILERYLNAVYYGHGAYGIEAAARTFFGVHANNLTLAQSALIAGLIQSPNAYDPFTPSGKTLSTSRQKVVLAKMHDLGWISKKQQTAAAAQPLMFKSTQDIRRMPYVQDAMRAQISKWYGDSALATGGLKVWTTIRPRAQQQAEQTLRKHLYDRDDPAGALVSIDNATGQIIAMASSGRYGASQFNLATQARRQPGSSAKIWALAALIDSGVDPRRLEYTSMPIKVRRKQDVEAWEPQTYDGAYPGRMDLGRATVRSDNSVYAQLALDLGPDKIAQSANQWGIGRRLSPAPSIVLGSQEVSVLEQTTFYATIASGGVFKQPQLIRQMQRQASGNLSLPRASSRRVARAERVQVITDFLQDNVRYGTGTAASLGSRPSAGKTGTTDDYKDAWYCGFTVQLTTCVWVGHIKPHPMLNVHGRSISGGTIPAEIWQDYNELYHQRLPVREFPYTAEFFDSWPNKTFQTGNWKSDPELEIIEPFYKPLGES